MDLISELTDEEFVPFLKNLGVETYGKSFEWMLNDPEISKVMNWMFRNLDQNNALSSHEEYRYLELQKEGKLLPKDELEKAVSNILDTFEGIPMPGDQDIIQDLKLQISFQDEKLKYLHKHENTLSNLILENKKRNEEVNHELSKFNAQLNQYKEDEETAEEKCLTLAEQVENIKEEVVGSIAETLSTYENTHMNKDIAQNFLTFGPFEGYRQSQRLFQSHFHLYASKMFNNKEVDSLSDKQAKIFLIEAKRIGNRLHNCVISYINSVADLSGVQAMLSLVINYDEVPASKIPVCTVENRAAVELLEQESLILGKQIQFAAKNFVDKRTNIVAESTLRSALEHREKLYKDLCWLHDIVHTALCLDSLLYYATRNELQSVEDLLQFATDLRDYIIEEENAVASRIEQMENICAEHSERERRVEANNPLLDALRLLYGVNPDDGFEVLIAKANDAQRRKIELKEKLYMGFEEKEDLVTKMKQSKKALEEYIGSGCTTNPSCWDSTVSKINRELIKEMADVEKMIVNVSSRFMSLKDGDKRGMRKLWQWFLTDPPRLLAKLQDVGAFM